MSKKWFADWLIIRHFFRSSMFKFRKMHSTKCWNPGLFMTFSMFNMGAYKYGQSLKLKWWIEKNNMFWTLKIYSNYALAAIFGVVVVMYYQILKTFSATSTIKQLHRKIDGCDLTLASTTETRYSCEIRSQAWTTATTYYILLIYLLLLGTNIRKSWSFLCH